MIKKLIMNKWVLIIILSLVVIITIRVTWMNFLTTLEYPNAPRATQGVLDLREWKFNDKQTLSLNGEWEFYPDHFLSFNDQIKETPFYLDTPMEWNIAFDNRDSFSHGTYRLQILLNDENLQEFALKINKLHNASTIFINGKQVGESGLAAITEKKHIGSTVPYTVSFEPKQTEVEIIIHASSNRLDGGIVKPIQFGTDKAINFQSLLSIGLQLLLVFVLVIHSLYAFILYFMRFSMSKTIFYFSLLLIFAIITVLGSDDKLLFHWISFSYEWEIKLVYLSYIGVGAFIPLVVKQIFPSNTYKKALRYFLIYCFLYAAFVLLTPPIYIYLTSSVLLSGVLLSSVFISLLNFRKAKINIDEGIYLILGCIIIGNNLIWTIFISNHSNVTMHYPFDLIIALLCFSAFWFKRFFRLTSESEQLMEKFRFENQRKDEFLVNTSHELRNPLNGISNIAQTLLEDKKNLLEKEHQEALSILVNISTRMSYMLNDLLDITRLQEKTIHLNLKETNIQSVITSVLDMAKLMLDGKVIQLKIDISDQFPAVLADENRLFQIFFNLIHNAIKFTDEGTITIRATMKKDLASIQIEDTGIGIQEDELSNIFKAYEQGAINAERASGGFGLGLSISKQLVELHNGSMSVQSSPGEGSIFTFTLPICNEKHNKQKASASTPFVLEDISSSMSAATLDNEEDNPRKVKLKLLLVDDDPVNLNILTTILEKDDYSVTRAISGTQAMKILERNHFDLVITDVMMPYVSGYELTYFIRERYSASELPVLLLTARTRTDDVLSGFKSGANDYVTKPIDIWEFKARVRALTDLKVSIEELIRMEGAWLQSQIQPHFIFNTLNSIAALSQFDVTKMNKLLEEFSLYLRLSFDFHNAEPVVPLEHELSLIRSYLYIEKTRFGDRLTIEWDMDKNIDIVIPPLSIQPIVENAVIHGILPFTKGGKITLRIKEQPNHVDFTISDTGKGITKENLKRLFTEDHPFTGSGVGLRNVERRLQQFYGRGLTVQSEPNKGTTVTFTIPK
ncbi:ATP-binding protein [Virgibacillus sp. W0181]|uniref:hybrid sensor histidine kinase/response regulator n=1 Tax=Virgibacillus sp. W0181 TaxID=3391581 RepID=UPI003F44CB47